MSTKSHTLKHTCVICLADFRGRGHDPAPLFEEGRCCDDCNEAFVLPIRVKRACVVDQRMANARAGKTNKIVLIFAAALSALVASSSAASAYDDFHAHYGLIPARPPPIALPAPGPNLYRGMPYTYSPRGGYLGPPAAGFPVPVPVPVVPPSYLNGPVPYDAPPLPYSYGPPLLPFGKPFFK
jgi:hypothetical protein